MRDTPRILHNTLPFENYQFKVYKCIKSNVFHSAILGRWTWW